MKSVAELDDRLDALEKRVSCARAEEGDAREEDHDRGREEDDHDRGQEEADDRAEAATTPPSLRRAGPRAFRGRPERLEA